MVYTASIYLSVLGLNAGEMDPTEGVIAARRPPEKDGPDLTIPSLLSPHPNPKSRTAVAIVQSLCFFIVVPFL